jgi:hypothetical protein
VTFNQGLESSPSAVYLEICGPAFGRGEFWILMPHCKYSICGLLLSVTDRS